MRIRARDVLDYVAAIHGLTHAEMTGSCRQRRFARPRQIAMYAMHHLCPHMSYPAIAQMIGGRDHTTVMHGVRRIEVFCHTNPEISDTVEKVLARFLGRSPVISIPAFQALCASYSQAMREAA